MKLKKEATLSDNVKLAQLPPRDASCPSGKELVVAGWGQERVTRWDDRGYLKKHNLWAVKQECLNVSRCDTYVGDKDAILCVGDSIDNDNSACFGDSGGNYFLIATKWLVLMFKFQTL